MKTRGRGNVFFNFSKCCQVQLSNLPSRSLGPGLSHTELNLSSLAERIEVSNLEQMGNLTWAFKHRLKLIHFLYSFFIDHITPSPQCVPEAVFQKFS